MDENFSVLALLTLGPEGLHCEGLSCMLQDVQHQLWTLPTRCSSDPAVQQPEIPLGIIRRPFASKITTLCQREPFGICIKKSLGEPLLILALQEVAIKHQTK